MDFPFSLVSGKAVHALVHGDIPGCVRIIESAYRTHQAGDSVNPNSFFLRFPDNPSARIIGLPAHLGGPFGLSGIKWIASFPANVKKGFPRASAVLILNNDETGYPYALLESSIISAARTAASAVLAAEWLHGREKRFEALGIVGTGLIARYVYDFFVGNGWELPKIRLFDLDPREAARFRDGALKDLPPDRVELCDGLESVMQGSDCILFATVAPAPYVHDPALLAHNPLVLHLSLRDLAPELLLRAHNIVDDVGHVMNADTSPHLAEKLTGDRAFVNGTLAQVISGEVQVDRGKPIIFSPFGLGVLDLALGKWIHERAFAAGTALPVPDFFFELSR